jgi:hypothetical protein
MLVAAAAFSVLTADGASMLNYRTTWIGNTYGGIDGSGNHKWVPIAVEAIAATPDGTLLSNTPWDEGGGELAAWHDGQATYGMATHGWGNAGGDAVAANNEYVYAAMTIGNEGGGLVGRGDYPDKGRQWFGVTRRRRSDISAGAQFSGGRGNLTTPTQRSFLLVEEVGEKDDASIRGLAVNEHTLYVADQFGHQIRSYDAATMQAGPSWAVDGPGALALAPDGSLWAIVDFQAAKPRLAHFSATGAVLHDTVTLPADSVAVSLAFDSRGSLFVADNGPRQQVLIFTPGSGAAGGMQADGAFGDEGGIYGDASGAPGLSGAAVASHVPHASTSSRTSKSENASNVPNAPNASVASPRTSLPPGTPGPLRFNGLTGVAADAHGNIYVAMNGRGPRTIGKDNGGVGDGAVLEGYSADGHRLFRLEGLLFVDGADVDRGSVSQDGNTLSVYTGNWHFTLDLSKSAPGSEWHTAGFTANRFRYPDDALYHANRSERGMPMVRRIEGKPFVFYTDMFSEMLKIYRFDPAHEGETAIPAGLIGARTLDWPPERPNRGEWMWRDANGDGRINREEIQGTGVPADDATCWYVDLHGDVWEGFIERGVRRYRLEGLDHFGNPRYDYAHADTFAMPAPFTRIQRIVYVPETDTMFLSGSTAEFPWDKLDWNESGKVIARYDHWSTKRTLRFQIPVDSWSTKVEPVEGIAQEGDYLFVVERATAQVRVYDANNGSQVGAMRPGPEVGSHSGYIDVPMGMTVYRRANGEYLVFVEEDSLGKVILYRWTPGGPPH